VFGTNFTGATSVTFNGTAASFTVVSGTRIDTTVPPAATTGKIRVTTPDGTATSAGDFTVTGAGPTITSFNPTSGPVGTAVTVFGTGFTGATSVRFNGVAATFSVFSGTQINTAVPSGATTGRITVTTPNGTATSATDFTVTAPALTITSFNLTSGTVAPPWITGTSFAGATSVRFNGTAAAPTVVSSTQISTSVLSGATTGRSRSRRPAARLRAAATSRSRLRPTITSFSRPAARWAPP
jgi:hypothetical protein